MENINFIKNIDNLGRIVIPMDIRKKMNINTGDILSITCNENDICLKKYSTLTDNYKILEIVKCFVEVFNLKVLILDREKVVYSNVVADGSFLDKTMKEMVENGMKLRNELNDFKFDNEICKGIYNMQPIITNEGIIGSVIDMGDVIDNAFEICSIMVKIMSIELNIS